jgi:hypothetical protein
MVSKPMAAVGTQPKIDKKSINPRATRYGFLPLWTQQTSARDFYVWKIPANQVFPFRPFIGEIGYDPYGKELYRTERLPAEQVTDLQRLNQFFVELTPLDRLESEEAAERVASVLINPNTCPKYEMELGNECTTCWLKYLFAEAADKAKGLEDAAERKAARECIQLLTAGMSKALEEARRLVDIAIRDIDDPKSGKTAFTAKDYLNIYNTHSERPQYKTTASGSGNIDQLVSALTGALKKDEAPNVDVAALLSEMSSMREELAKLKATPEVDKAEEIKKKITKEKDS